jgi:hypothetical protein
MNNFSNGIIFLFRFIFLFNISKVDFHSINILIIPFRYFKLAFKQIILFICSLIFKSDIFRLGSTKNSTNSYPFR